MIVILRPDLGCVLFIPKNTEERSKTREEFPFIAIITF